MALGYGWQLLKVRVGHFLPYLGMAPPEPKSLVPAGIVMLAIGAASAALLQPA